MNLILVLILLIFVILVLIYLLVLLAIKLNRTKKELKQSKYNFNRIIERLAQSEREKENLRSGNSTDSFNACNDLLQKYSKRKD